MDLPEALKTARSEAGLTQQALASAAGLAIGTVTRAERGGGVTMSTLDALADALDTTVADLVA